MLRRWLAAAWVLALPLGPAACAPTIEDIEIDEVTEGEPIPVEAEITPYLSHLRDVRLAVGPHPPPHGPYQDAGVLTEIADNRYEGTSAGQTYGGYELRVEVDYRYGFFPFVSDTRHKVKTFLVDGPPSCFTFDGEGVELDGWRIEGVYDGDLPDPVADPDLPFFWLDSSNWPEPKDAARAGDTRGAAIFSIDLVDIPADPDLYSTGYWRVSLVSPDLTGRSAWQSPDGGIRFWIMTEAKDLDVQPLLRVRRADGTTVHLFEKGPQGKPVFHRIETTGAWLEIAWRFELPDDVSEVLEAEVRIFGAVGDLAYNNGAESFLDGVCPR